MPESNEPRTRGCDGPWGDTGGGCEHHLAFGDQNGRRRGSDVALCVHRNRFRDRTGFRERRVVGGSVTGLRGCRGIAR
ncbi:hypothetical protein AWC05_20950 [Mycobacterium florentinum]|uniref:Uncharacterized protein n=1 Tax=Mycobacterium florentinum TaxID=292462 RepID=A0A1X1U5B4_MYCFL|nr:hypothetical protein [Mycobacterium florentinum]MCV7410394.1 hypothetical protein [Mycobacterium florentinum]ORV52021.1 hypothetical protein AWC05_20950 [Mycobacterium florentinum]